MKNIYTIVYKLLEVEKEISQDKGPFNLFALFLRDDKIDWDILVSSDWTDKDKYESIRYISSKIKNKLNIEELTSISGIEIIDSINPDLEAIYRTVNIEHSIAEIENHVFFRFLIKYAYIITSKKNISLRENNMLRMIGTCTYECPYCGYKSNQMFPIEHYEAGSAGRRTYRCPRCSKELEE